jgi:hypothetical protein
MKKEDPKAYDKFMKLEQLTKDYIQRISSSNPADRLINDNGTITIPVVVHVIHSGQALGTGRNIPDQQVFNQIAILNEDFNRLNADRVNTPAVFQGGNVNIRFVLACIDPNGLGTTGINRFQSTTTDFSVDGNTAESPAKHTNQGGVDAWPTDRYLNIWVCSLTNGILGAGTFPSDYTLRPNIDGLIIDFEAFGSGGNSVAPFDLGRTATHEVGHWLNLTHIWGDEGACSGTDNCNDTPNQGDFTPPSITPVFPNRTSCGNNGDMWMNFMDYSADRFMNLFTQDQVNRMRAVFQPGGERRGFIDNYFTLTKLYSSCSLGYYLVRTPFCEANNNITWSIAGLATTSDYPSTFATVYPQSGANGTAILTASWNNFTSDITIPVGYGNEGSLYSYSGNTFANTPIYSGGYYPAKSNSFGNVSFTGASGTAQNWRVVSQTGYAYFNGSGNSFNVGAYPPSSNITVEADVNTACGLKTIQYTFYYSRYGYGGGGYSYRLSPNPASNSITIQASNLNPDPNARLSDIPEYDVQIYNRFSQLMKKVKSPKGAAEIQVDVNGLPSNQLYTARIVSGTDIQNISFFKE